MEKSWHSVFREESIMTPHWICLFYLNLCLLLILFTKVYLMPYILMACLRESCPLCLNVKPKCLYSGACPPVDAYRKQEINISPPKMAIQVMFVRLIVFSLYFLTLSPFLFYKKNLAPRILIWTDYFWGNLVCHLLSQPDFWVKSYSLPQHLIC